MSGDDETIAGIVREMLDYDDELIENFADRIEAAHKREVEAVVAADLLRDKERGEEIERLRGEVERLRNGAKCDWNSNRCGGGCLVFDDNTKLTARGHELREEVERLRAEVVRAWAAVGQEEERVS